jgi:predicted metalloprotease with PDZ domain
VAINIANAEIEKPAPCWQYDIKHVIENNLPYFLIKATLKNPVGTHTKIRMPSSAMGHCAIHDQNNYSCKDEYKPILDVKNCTLELSHPRGENLEIQYAIGTGHISLAPFDSPLMAVVTKNYFSSSACSLLANIVNDARYNDTAQYTINWNLPKNFSVYTTFGFGKTQSFYAPFNNFGYNILVGGEVNKNRIDRKRYLISPKNIKINKRQLLKTLRNNLTLIKQLWQEDIAEDYLVSFNKITDASNGGVTGLGIGYTNNLIYFVYDKGLNDMESKALLAHEMLHSRIGAEIKINDAAWFNEGFTDYYGYRFFLINSKDLSELEEYVKKYNKVLDYYYTSGKKFNIKKINDSDYHNFITPYFLGMMMASELDYNIKINSNNNSSLEHLMRGLHKEAKTKKPLTEQDFTKVGKQYFPAIEHWLKDRITDKSKYVPQNGEFGSCIKVVKYKRRIQDYGFDYITSLALKKIKNIKRGSLLYKGGIREDQEIIDYDYPYPVSNENHPIKLRLNTDEGPRTVEIHRQGKLIEIPQLEIDYEIYRKQPDKCLEYFKMH